jgi:RNA recognition motif-containing protein
MWNCRGLPSDDDICGRNKEIEFQMRSIFVSGLSLDMTAKDLEEKFAPYGLVKIAKIIFEPVLVPEQISLSKYIKCYDYEQPYVSKGHGVVCF